MKVCVYAICKDEIGLVDKWVQSMSEADEIYVLDTGSTDGSDNRLEELGCHVTKREIVPWRFDRARNEAMELIPEDADIIVSTDIDERFDPGWRAEVERAWERVPGCNTLRYPFVFYEREVNGNKEESIFWKGNITSRHGFRWKCPCHEVIVPTGVTIQSETNEIRLRHYYVPKNRRSSYLDLLKLAVEEEPNDARMRYYLGREYTYISDWQNAVETLTEYVRIVGEQCWHDEKAQGMLYLAQSYRALNDLPKAEEWALRAVAESEGAEPSVFLAQLYCDTERYTAAKYYADLSLTIKKNLSYVRDPACYGSKPHLLACVADWHLGHKESSKKHAERCLEIEPHNEQYKRNMTFYTEFPKLPESTPYNEPLPDVVHNNKRIGIAVAANNIDEETIDEFMRNKEFLRDGDEIFINAKRTLGVYNPSRNKNIAIANAVKAGMDIVVQTDIDMLLSRELIEETRNAVKEGKRLFYRAVYGNEINRTGYGAWNAQTALDWIKCGGLDERMFGYGYEDTGLYANAEKHGIEILEGTRYYPYHRPHKAGRAMSMYQLDSAQYKRNGELIGIPTRRNYIKARVEGDISHDFIKTVTFLTNATCPRRCPQCSQKFNMEDLGNWQASLDDALMFVKCSEVQSYVFDHLYLAGGDPLLWKNLIPAVKMFKESGMFKNINLFTGIINRSLIDELSEYADHIYFSHYGVEPGFDNPKMIILRSQNTFYNRPERFYPESLPARCNCPGLYVIKGQVYKCPNVRDILLRSGKDYVKENYSEPLTSQFLDLLIGDSIYDDEFCSACVGNLNVRPLVGTSDNTSEKVMVVYD